MAIQIGAPFFFPMMDGGSWGAAEVDAGELQAASDLTRPSYRPPKWLLISWWFTIPVVEIR